MISAGAILLLAAFAGTATASPPADAHVCIVASFSS
eukprot:CAMPEP_0174860398 /NCGR_PEP_ID=MMETSP1114-20130205/49091_1 /TAXON_ID=312471 /ORGANISM="Neobodo designis, Strain CCAP 1951/1" /LENGTH=35 /DNA_ID= /DNA_START= /DNA_END= /DNA_ORIENTATION=